MWFSSDAPAVLRPRAKGANKDRQNPLRQALFGGGLDLTSQVYQAASEINVHGSPAHGLIPVSESVKNPSKWSYVGLNMNGDLTCMHAYWLDWALVPAYPCTGDLCKIMN